MKLKVMTYNIQHGNVHLGSGIDLTKVAEVVRQSGADVIGLNEVRGRGESSGYFAQAEALAAGLNYHCYFGRSIYVNGSDPYGNAVLSRYPIVEAGVARIPAPTVKNEGAYYEPRSICRCVIETPSEQKRLAVYATHFGLTREELPGAVSKALALSEQEPYPHVLMGDFNAEPDEPYLRPIYEKFRSTDGFLDQYKPSFPSDQPQIRIDYIFASAQLNFISADMINRVASDHLPIIAEIEL